MNLLYILIFFIVILYCIKEYQARLTFQIEENEDYPLFKFDCDTVQCNETVEGIVLNGLFTTDAYCQYVENTPRVIRMNGEQQSFSCSIVNEELAVNALTNFSQVRFITRDINQINMVPILESGSDRWLKSYHMTINISKVHLNSNAWEITHAQVTTQYFGRVWRQGDIITRQYTIHNGTSHLAPHIMMILAVFLISYILL
mmetsp:Transcript_13840/g.20960  ORF Transcript_13840/g.20960 Transcript_13840/m.20960 type:complete len:201 (+) Transcript_13840:17-619(+)